MVLTLTVSFTIIILFQSRIRLAVWYILYLSAYPMLPNKTYTLLWEGRMKKKKICPFNQTAQNPLPHLGPTPQFFIISEPKVSVVCE